MTDRRLIVGLGNPGPDYRGTRHNLGFLLVERLAERWRALPTAAACRSLLWNAGDLTLAQPQTYMNRSGWALECLVDLLGVEPKRLLVVFDDIALPFGTLRLRARGGAGGHRGMESVLASLRTEDVPRLRMGIAPAAGLDAEADLSDFVLSPFPAGERAAVDELLSRAAEAAEAWRDLGIDEAMNRANR